MSEFGQQLEELVGVIIVLVGAVFIWLHVNKHIFGRHFPLIDLIRRILHPEHSKKAMRQARVAVLFQLLVVVGIILLVWLSKFFHG